MRVGNVVTLNRPNGEQLRAGVSEFKGKTYIGVRVYYAGGSEFLPGKNGLNLSIDEAPLLFRAVDELKAAYVAQGGVL